MELAFEVPLYFSRADKYLGTIDQFRISQGLKTILTNENTKLFRDKNRYENYATYFIWNAAEDQSTFVVEASNENVLDIVVYQAISSDFVVGIRYSFIYYKGELTEAMYRIEYYYSYEYHRYLKATSRITEYVGSNGYATDNSQVFTCSITGTRPICNSLDETSARIFDYRPGEDTESAVMRFAGENKMIVSPGFPVPAGLENAFYREESLSGYADSEFIETV